MSRAAAMKSSKARDTSRAAELPPHSAKITARIKNSCSRIRPVIAHTRHTSDAAAL
jgi:hypothetical protein